VGTVRVELEEHPALTPSVVLLLTVLGDVTLRWADDPSDLEPTPEDARYHGEDDDEC
jgi:hypothetical protein